MPSTSLRVGRVIDDQRIEIQLNNCSLKVGAFVQVIISKKAAERITFRIGNLSNERAVAYYFPISFPLRPVLSQSFIMFDDDDGKCPTKDIEEGDEVVLVS